jgi:lipoprotein-anchoring transpeptidase ErfK/SrfK
MNSSVYYRIVSKLTLSAIALFFGLQSSVTAQTKLNSQTSTQINNTQPNSTPILDTSHEPPAVPSTVERMRGLQMRLKSPVSPTLESTTEQNIHLLLVLQQRTLYVYRGDVLEASFPVAVGKPQWETPTGKFKVINKVENPAWENPFVDDKQVIPPGEQNPLGERWIGFWSDGKDEIGFHGTYKRDSVGQAISHGCVRLYNEDVRKLYEIVTIGTPVTVVP